MSCGENSKSGNVSGLRIAEEASLKTLPASPVWVAYEPNSYSDFGGQITTQARNPINESRQRQKGVTTDLDASGGFSQDFVQKKLRDILQGFMFADWRPQPTDVGPLVGGLAGVTFTPVQYTASDVGGDINFAVGAHGLLTGDGPFHFVEGSGTLPGNILEDTEYWIVRVDAGNFSVAESHADAVATVPVLVAFSSAGVDDATRLLQRRVSVDGVNELLYMNDEAGFQAGNLVLVEGFTNAANNGLKRLTVVGPGVVTVDEDVVDEAVAPAAGKITVAGFQAAAGDVDVDVPGGGAKNAYTSTTLNFTTLGLVPGAWVFVGGDAAALGLANPENNGFKRVYSIVAGRLEVDLGGEDMIAEASTTETVRLFLPETLKNEADPALIVCRSYQLERTLGNDGVGIQSQYEVGAVGSTFQFNVGTAGKIECDMAFLALDEETRTGTVGVKAGARPALEKEEAFNTSSNFSRLKLTRLSTGLPLFAFVTEFNLTIDNSLQANKAVAVLGAFDVSPGQFVVSASITAYFADVTSKEAVRNNESVAFDFAVVKNNAGWAVSVPQVTLGNARLNVEQDAPITIPLSLDAGADPVFDHTLLLNNFPYLPNAAG